MASEFLDYSSYKYSYKYNNRNNKHIKRTDTFKIADKRAGNKLSDSQLSRVKKFHSTSINRKYDRYIKYFNGVI